MVRKSIALIGFGYSGATAYADALLNYNKYVSYPNYLEIDYLRKPNGLFDILILREQNALSKIFYLKLILKESFMLIKSFIGSLIRNIFVKNKFSFIFRYREIFIKLSCDIVYILTLINFFISNFSITDQKLISSFLSGIHKACGSKADKIMILNQISFIEHGIESLIKTENHDIKFLIILRDPFSQFYDIEKEGFFFSKGDLRQDVLLGVDAGGIWRRASFIDILILRCQKIRELILKYPNKILISFFEDLIIDFDIEFNRILDFQDIKISDLERKQITRNLREFDPEISKKNVLKRDASIKLLIESGYNEFLLQKLNKLELEYNLLKRGCL